VDDSWAGFFVFFLCDPHGLEGGEGSQDGATDPYGVFSLWGSNDLDLDGGWGKGSDFLLHSVGNTWVHCGTTRKDIVGEEILTDINVAPHDGVVDTFMDTNRFHTQEGWLEERFWATETFVTDGDDLTVRKFIGLVKRSRCGGNVHFRFEVKGDIAKFFLDVTDNFSLSGGGE